MKKILLTLIFSFIFVNNVNAQAMDEQIDNLNKSINEMNERLISEENERLNKMHPIGSIYITTKYSTANSVSNTIGGTWEAYGSGRTLIGVNASDNNFNVINKTGGVSSISLSTSNLPGHSHSIPALVGTTSSAGAHTHKFFYKNGEYTGFSYSNKSGNYINMYLGNVSVSAEHDNIKTKINDGGSHTHNVTMNRGSTGSTGSGTSFTNLPPYITVYMWKRVS